MRTHEMQKLKHFGRLRRYLASSKVIISGNGPLIGREEGMLGGGGEEGYSANVRIHKLLSSELEFPFVSNTHNTAGFNSLT